MFLGIFICTFHNFFKGTVLGSYLAINNNKLFFARVNFFSRGDLQLSLTLKKIPKSSNNQLSLILCVVHWYIHISFSMVLIFLSYSFQIPSKRKIFYLVRFTSHHFYLQVKWLPLLQYFPSLKAFYHLKIMYSQDFWDCTMRKERHSQEFWQRLLRIQQEKFPKLEASYWYCDLNEIHYFN